MGMAASQARFLQLTARKTNLESIGQQANQLRLALANASAGLFEKMLSLVPPTPPSSQDDKYYRQGYNFTDPADDIQKKLSWNTFRHGIVGVDNPPNDPANGILHDPKYFINVTSATGVVVGYDCARMAEACDDINSNNTQALIQALGIDNSKNSIGYTQAIRLVAVESELYDPDGNFKTVTKYEPVVLEFDNYNRLLNTYFLDGDIDMRAGATTNQPRIIGAGDKLTYRGKFDDTAYNNDMNKYEFQKSAYDYQIESINQETKLIQAQDRSLEMKMKQFDTEHNAIQTEIEAVQKVIQKNVEGSFKTFA